MVSQNIDPVKCNRGTKEEPKRPSYLARPPFPIQEGVKLRHLWRDSARWYLRRPTAPFEQAIHAVHWNDIGTVLDVLDALGNPGTMTVADLYNIMDSYLTGTEEKAHHQAYLERTFKLSPS